MDLKVEKNNVEEDHRNSLDHLGARSEIQIPEIILHQVPTVLAASESSFQTWMTANHYLLEMQGFQPNSAPK
jgi:hypothetical protein